MMTQLRQRMLEELQRRNYSPRVEQQETCGVVGTPHKVDRNGRYSATMLLWQPCFATS